MAAVRLISLSLAKSCSASSTGASLLSLHSFLGRVARQTLCGGGGSAAKAVKTANGETRANSAAEEKRLLLIISNSRFITTWGSGGGRFYSYAAATGAERERGGRKLILMKFPHSRGRVQLDAATCCCAAAAAAAAACPADRQPKGAAADAAGFYFHAFRVIVGLMRLAIKIIFSPSVINHTSYFLRLATFAGERMQSARRGNSAAAAGANVLHWPTFCGASLISSRSLGIRAGGPHNATEQIPATHARISSDET